MSPALTTVLGLLLPFAGTAAGSACVFLLRGSLRLSVHRFLLGFAAGVMTAASVFSLLLPAIEASA
ncbi:MAG: ZIP family metal transporter, partial [Oscillospiraceae bacterium]|nr:ZIP family metal transporter [Oscillospiraceae bacterium]